jgi:hypothetical protein
MTGWPTRLLSLFTVEERGAATVATRPLRLAVATLEGATVFIDADFAHRAADGVADCATLMLIRERRGALANSTEGRSDRA